jgi:2',3'-cyclic-nucleotide 2'-phosphodiesterase (5'-nucleotidase family)
MKKPNLNLFILPFFVFLCHISLGQNIKKQHALQSFKQYPSNIECNEFDSAMAKKLAFYKSELKDRMNDTIVFNERPLTKAQPESSMGNWIADVVKGSVQQKTHACILSYNLIQADYLPPGPLLRKDFYDLIPIENKIILIKISGLKLKAFCDTIASIGGTPISGLSFTISNNKAENIKIENQAINDFLIYTIAINDFMLTNKKFIALLNKIPMDQSNKKIRNILIEFAATCKTKNQQIISKLDNRIHYAE